jgi:hypothetical protein
MSVPPSAEFISLEDVLRSQDVVSEGPTSDLRVTERIQQEIDYKVQKNMSKLDQTIDYT